MLNKNNKNNKNKDIKTTALLLVNIYYEREVDTQFYLPCPEGKTVSQAVDFFCEQWEKCVQALDDEDPDDNWTINDVVERMKLSGWQLREFEDTIDVEV